MSVQYHIQKKFPLKNLNTFGFDVLAEHYVPIKDKETFELVIEKAEKPFFILGGGSNILLTGDIMGTVLHNQIGGIQVIKENDKTATIEVGGGVIWHDLVLWSLDKNLGGLENLSLIPGSVGAAPIQNIGAYGVELKDVFDSLEAWSLEDGSTVIFDQKSCKFAYRDSVFKHIFKGKYFIAKVRLILQKPPHDLKLSYGNIRQELEKTGQHRFSIQDVSRAVIAIRQSKLPDPEVLGNAGSFFKNPEIPEHEVQNLLRAFPDMPVFQANEGHVKIPAAWLIDQCGWKGKKIGHVGCHKDQALVLVHYGGGLGKEILDLSRQIQEDVFQKFGIKLIPEVNII